jgi:drug/metabolite transporter (DMT)-like permease
MRVSSRKSSLFFLALGTALFAASFSVIKKLMELGDENLIDGRNPISFCNVLFVGNLVAGVAFILAFPNDCKPRKFSSVTAEQWVLILIIAFLEGALAPMLIFLALMDLSVASVFLVQSIQIPLVLLLGWIIHREVAPRLSVGGAILAFAGIALMVLLKTLTDVKAGDLEYRIGWNEGKVALAALSYVFATQLRRKVSWDIPMGAYSVVRIFVGIIFFLTIVMVMFGPSHFMDLFSPFLWKWMLFYGAAVVMVGQAAWHLGLRASTSTDISIAEAATPVLGIVFAFLILGQVPSLAEWMGGAVILLGILFALRGTMEQEEKLNPINYGVNKSVDGSSFAGI